MSRMPPRIARLFRFVVGVLALIGGVAVLTLATTATTVCGHRLSGPIEEPTAPLLIVLTAASPMDGMLSESSYWRSIYAIRAWRSGGFERILLSGEQSAAMKRFLVSEGVPSERVDLEENARSTRESALFTAAMLRGRSGPPPVLMTSDYHMFRARKCFEKAGLRVLPRPIPDAIKRSAEWYDRPTILAIEIVEVSKIAGYRLRGWI
jgi:uncharacterized SAM-binding protein YcdF (DUF218 family)